MRYLIWLFAFILWPNLIKAQSKQAVMATNEFGIDLYKQLRKQPGNFILSPLSLETALAMTSAGAQSETLTEMFQILHLSAGYNVEFKNMIEKVKGNSDFELLLVNRMWGSKGSQYEPSFIKVIEGNYGASLFPLDFKGHPESSRVQINTWVGEQTKGKIKDILPTSSINQDTELVITNAIYFKGNWLNEFKKELTTNDYFFYSVEGKKTIPFLRQTSEFNYAENSEVQFLEMLYRGNELTLDIVLPKAGIELSAIENKLNLGLIQELTNKCSSINVDLTLPRFRSDSKFGLREVLSAMGMRRAFDKKKANFSGIRRTSPGDNIFISQVFHQTFIEINEEGTEASAATAVAMDGGGTLMDPRPPKVFKANRPFLYFIRHRGTGIVLFMGRYSQP